MLCIFFNGKEKDHLTEKCQLIYVEGTAELEGHFWHLNNNQVGQEASVDAETSKQRFEWNVYMVLKHLPTKCMSNAEKTLQSIKLVDTILSNQG